MRLAAESGSGVGGGGSAPVPVPGAPAAPGPPAEDPPLPGPRGAGFLTRTVRTGETPSSRPPAKARARRTSVAVARWASLKAP